MVQSLFSSSNRTRRGSYSSRRNDSDNDTWDTRSEDIEKEYGEFDSSDDEDDDEIEMRGLVSGSLPKGFKKKSFESSTRPRSGIEMSYAYHPFPRAIQWSLQCLSWTIGLLILSLFVINMGERPQYNTDQGLSFFGYVSKDRIHAGDMDWIDGDDLVEGYNYNYEIAPEEGDEYMDNEIMNDHEVYDDDSGRRDIPDYTGVMHDDDFNILRRQDDLVDMEEEEEKDTVAEKVSVGRIAILGERNSGVNWFTKKLGECFPKVEVTSNLSRPSHFFQSPAIMDEKDRTKTLVIPVFLNPFSWSDTMRRHPRYMPKHMNMEWKEFLSTPWTIDRPLSDLELLKESDGGEDARICELGFKYDEIVACSKIDIPDGMKKNDVLPLYELDHWGTGSPYKSILDLRAAKIRNFLSIITWEHVELFLPLQYETLTAANGFSQLVDEIALQTGLQAKCDATHESFKAPVFWESELDVEYVTYMNTYADWEAESLIGYNTLESVTLKEGKIDISKNKWYSPPKTAFKGFSHMKLRIPTSAPTIDYSKERFTEPPTQDMRGVDAEIYDAGGNIVKPHAEEKEKDVDEGDGEIA